VREVAQSMQRLSKDDLLKLLDQYADDDFVGVLFTAARDIHSDQSTIFVFYDKVTEVQL
jgi:hypothetical protein